MDIADQPVSIGAPGNIAPLLARALELIPPDSMKRGAYCPGTGGF